MNTADHFSSLILYCRSLNSLAHFNISNFRSIAILIVFFLPTGCQSREEINLGFDRKLDLSNQQDTVILLHGMWRNEAAMRPVERFLNAQGYNVLNIAYPSTDYPIETLVENYLKPAVDGLKRTSNQKLHFVTHSMGGILVRYYLKHNMPEGIGRVVMLAPPNQGTELATLFADSEWIDVKRGPAAEQLSTGKKSWVNQLGPVNFELGVIAGNYNSNWLTDWILPGEDDGVVSVESTRVENMKDFMTIPVKHYRIRANATALNQTAHFLKFGRFYHSLHST